MTTAQIAALPHGRCACVGLPREHLLGVAGCTLATPDRATVLVRALMEAQRAERRLNCIHLKALLAVNKARLALILETSRNEYGQVEDPEKTRHAIASLEAVAS